MQTDILLKQIQQHIHQLKTSLEEFESALQPDSALAEHLHGELNKLNKLIGAYAFIKQQQELSPRLDLHMKVSEKLPQADVQTKEVKQEIQEGQIPLFAELKKEPVQSVPEPVKQTIIEPVKTEQEKTADSSISQYPKINISINDKFRLINELFKSNTVEYGIAIEQINAIGNWHDTQVYLNGLKNIYSWDEDNDMVKKIFSLSQKRFL